MNRSSALRLACGLFGVLPLLSISARAQQIVQLNVPTGGVTGTYYMIGAPLANYINNHSQRLRMTPSTSGGGYENIRRVDAAQAQIGMTQPDTMYEAWNGEAPFTKPLRDWRVIGRVVPPMANHVITAAEANIKSADDLKGKTFAIGAPGSGAAIAMKRFLDLTGLSGEINVQMLPHQDYPDMLMDGKVDAINRQGTVPSAVVEEISAQRPISLVDFGAALKASGFFEKYPFYQPIPITAGTYPGIEKDITVFGSSGFLIAHKDVPDDIVYEFTKLAYSDGAIQAVEAAFKSADLDPKNPLEGNIGPVHPGAAKYWKELGVDVPEPLLK